MLLSLNFNGGFTKRPDRATVTPLGDCPGLGGTLRGDCMSTEGSLRCGDAATGGTLRGEDVTSGDLSCALSFSARMLLLLSVPTSTVVVLRC